MSRRTLPRPVRPLSNLQVDALLCLAEGLTTEDAADRLGIAPVTLHGWVRNIASMLPDDPLCPEAMSPRQRVERYAVALFWGPDAPA